MTETYMQEYIEKRGQVIRARMNNIVKELDGLTLNEIVTIFEVLKTDYILNTGAVKIDGNPGVDVTSEVKP